MAMITRKLQHSMIPSMIILALISSTLIVHPAFSTSLGVVFIYPKTTPVQSINSNFTIQVKIANESLFNTFEIQVQTDPTVINATSVSINAAFPIVAQECINGVILVTTCSPTDGPGIVHVVAGTFGSTNANQILFNVTYQAIGSGSYSPIHLETALVIYQGNPVQMGTPGDGTYGVAPDFSIFPNDPLVKVTQGSSANTTVTLKSVYSFSGVVNLTSSSPGHGLRVSLSPAKITLKAAGINTTTVTVYADSSANPTSYSLNINGTSGLIGTSRIISHVTTITLSVQQVPYFLIQALPSLMRIHATNSGVSTIVVTGENLFSGKVTLSFVSPQGVDASLSPNVVTIVNGSTATTTLTVQTPASSVPFLYSINMTASSGLLPPQRAAIYVKPPLSDIAVSESPSLITVQAGRSASTTVNVASTDYLWGTVNFAAVMAGGAASFGQNTIFLPPPSGGTGNTTLEIVMGNTVAAGHYVLLLTVYAVLNDGRTVSHTFPITLIVTSTQRVSTLIFALEPLVYFAVLSAATVVWAVLSVLTYRRSRLD